MSKSQTHPKHDMHQQDILAAIRKRGTTLYALGKAHGYKSPRTLNNVFYMPYPKVEKIIADFLGLPPEEIWPSRYEQPRGFRPVVRTADGRYEVAAS